MILFITKKHYMLMNQFFEGSLNNKKENRKLAEKYYNEGIESANNKNFDYAELCFRNGIAADPNYSYSYNGIGLLYLFKKNYEEAKFYIEKALKLDPFNAKIITNLGGVYREQDKIEQAILQYEEALSNDPTYSPAITMKNRMKELLRIKGVIEDKMSALSMMVVFTKCSAGHQNIQNDCNYCNTIDSDLLKKIDSIGKLWRELFQLFNFYLDNDRFIELLNDANLLKFVRHIVYNLNNLSIRYEKDIFNYPLDNWDNNSIVSGYQQILYNCRGFTIERYINAISVVDIRNMMESLYYSFLNFEKTKVENVYKITFIHKVYGNVISLYSFVDDIETLNNSPFYFNVMPLGFDNRQVIVSMRLLNGIVKPLTNNTTLGVKSEHTYVKQLYPKSKIQKQEKTKLVFNNNEIDVDILTTDNNDTLVFDISEFYGKGIVTVFSDLKKSKE